MLDEVLPDRLEIAAADKAQHACEPTRHRAGGKHGREAPSEETWNRTQGQWALHELEDPRIG